MGDAWEGRPQNPERDGWHWVMPARGIGITSPRLWHAQIARWEMLDGTLSFATEAAEMWRYVAPCITPDEVAAREAAAAEAMREAAGNTAASFGDGPFATRRAALAIAALPLPAADALARALDQARTEEREACALEVDCGCAARADVLARLATDDEKRASYLCVHGDVCCALQAAAIRARGKEASGE